MYQYAGLIIITLSVTNTFVMYVLCRWVCKHFGTTRETRLLRRTGKHPNQYLYSTDCYAAVYVSYSKELQVSVIAMVLLNDFIVVRKRVAIHI